MKISIKNETEIQKFSNKNRELICSTVVLKMEFFREKTVNTDENLNLFNKMKSTGNDIN